MNEQELIAAKKHLLIYELPSISEWCGWGWAQELVAKYVAWKVNRKFDRLVKRMKRAEMLGRTEDMMNIIK